MGMAFAEPKRYERTGEGRWTFGPESRVVLCRGGLAYLALCVSMVGKDHPALAAAPRLWDGTQRPRPGDLVLRVGEPAELAGVETFGEGYVVRLGETAELTAQSYRGMMYGLRTLMELGAQAGLDRGLIADWPDAAVRALHLDLERERHAPEWVEERIREMSRERLNTLWLRLPEAEGPGPSPWDEGAVRRVLQQAEFCQIDVKQATDSFLWKMAIENEREVCYDADSSQSKLIGGHEAMEREELRERLLGAWIGLNGMLKSSRVTEEMTYNEAVVMKLVYDRYRADGVGRTAVSHIVRETKMLKSLVNRTVTALCAQGYLRRERGEEDARKLYVSPVEEKLPGFLAVHRRSLELAEQIVAVIGEEDALRFTVMYEKLAASGLRL